MAPPQGAAAYKKQNGILALSRDRKAVSWAPSQPPDASPTLVIRAADMTNLQQTPESNPKVMLKIFAQEKGQTESVAHVFNFTSPGSARVEANAIKDALTAVIQAQKAAQNVAAGLTPSGGTSAAMTIANAISGGNRPGNIWEDDDRLKTDVRLQQSLMSEDPALQKTFLEARSLKPDSITTTQFTGQFWSSRIHLLRAHALAKSQSRGTYNVFSALRKEEGGTKMNLNAEHIHMIFDQYPLMRRVYDEIVPGRLNEHDFWSRFFQSKLYRTLRGFKIGKDEAQDAILDQYLEAPELTGLRPTATELHIPKFVDLEGNEENNSRRQGNKPDTENQPEQLAKAPIIKVLNSLSEKLMAQVTPSDVNPSAPIGMDERTYESLRLQDLAGDPTQERMILNIQDQSRFFAEDRTSQEAKDRPRYRKIDPAKAVQSVHAEINSLFSKPGATIHVPEDDSESEDDDFNSNTQKKPSPSERAAYHIRALILSHRSQTTEIPPSSNLSPTIYDRLTLTHATTLEFLHQFWAAFLSGDPTRTGEIASLIESLNRAMTRIEAVAEAAEEERLEIVRDAERQAKEILEKTGKRQRVDHERIGGGRRVVRELLGPVIGALGNAGEKYRGALTEQMGDGEGLRQ